MQEALGPENAAVKVSLNGKSPEEAAKALIAGTKLEDVAVRQRLYGGGKAAVDARTDPLLLFIRKAGSADRAARQRLEDHAPAGVPPTRAAIRPQPGSEDHIYH